MPEFLRKPIVTGDFPGGPDSVYAHVYHSKTHYNNKKRIFTFLSRICHHPPGVEKMSFSRDKATNEIYIFHFII